eukprot:TRINITY_DN115235_c0_g1_i1.p1 TRINITY_DN115235_c0_g1~~TRINITY_DN115235_c0_g1_i1.p1  ORF type:complete len:213 (-),score=20.69 TRINITY_DN115235_c0_g1_i1:88-726(-)
MNPAAIPPLPRFTSDSCIIAGPRSKKKLSVCLDAASAQMVQLAASRDNAKLEFEVDEYCRGQLLRRSFVNSVVCLSLVVALSFLHLPAGRAMIQQWLCTGLLVEWSLLAAKLTRMGSLGQTVMQRSWWLAGCGIAVTAALGKQHFLLAAHVVCGALLCATSAALRRRDRNARSEVMRGVAASILLTPKWGESCNSSSTSSSSRPETPCVRLV